MPLQPLTTAGVQAKLSELYALTNNQLESEANNARNNLIAWLNNHFSLTAEQSSYLSVIDANFVGLISSEISFALRYRLEIIFKPSPPPPTKLSKLIHRNNKMTTYFSDTGGVTASGSLEFTVEYQ